MFLGLDQGTSGTRAVLLDDAGHAVAHAERDHAQHYPQPGWVEHDPREILAAVRACLNETTRGARVDAIGVANQGETVLIWDRQTGEPFGRALVWQDVRTQDAVDALAKDRALAQEITVRTGLRLDPYFVAPKLRWLLDRAPRGRQLCAGTIDTWLIWNLSGGKRFVTDPSTAARTLLFDIRTRMWDPWLCRAFGVPPEILPDVVPSTGSLADTPYGPITASVVDQPAALFGEGCLAPGDIKATFGTGCFVYLNAGTSPRKSAFNLLSTIAWQRGDETTYALDGGVFAVGAVMRWLVDELGLAANDAELDALVDSVPDARDVVCVPALVGLAAPYWRRQARAAWLGLDRGATRAHLVRAAFEGVAARVAQVVRAMERDAGVRIAALRVDGGVTRSAPLMKMVADLIGAPVHVSGAEDATVNGAAWMAARAAEIWKDDAEIRDRVTTQTIHEPSLGEAARAERLARFERAVMLTLEGAP